MINPIAVIFDKNQKVPEVCGMLVWDIFIEYLSPHLPGEHISIDSLNKLTWHLRFNQDKTQLIITYDKFHLDLELKLNLSPEDSAFLEHQVDFSWDNIDHFKSPKTILLYPNSL